MQNTHRRPTVASALLRAALVLSACGHDSSQAATPEHIRGTIQSVDGEALTATTSAGSVRVRLAPTTIVAAVIQSDPAHIAEGGFVGIASVTDPAGSQRAVGVFVLPEAMRANFEGSFGWDWPGDGAAACRMTNGTVSSSKMTNGTVTAQPGASSITLRYRNGPSSDSQTITVPPGTPVVAIEPGQAGDLQPGAHVLVVATRSSDGALNAAQVFAGKNGVVPPL